MTACLTVERHDAVARLILNRPQAHNPLDLELIDALGAAFDTLRDQPEVRAITLEGAGPSFCAGADLKFVLGVLDDGPALAHYIRRIRDVFNGIERFPRPVIAVVRGFAWRADWS